MSLLKAILEAQGGKILQQIAGNFNIDASQATKAVSQLLPSLTAGMKKNMASPQGLEGLLGALKRGNHTRYLENPTEITQPSTIEDGNGILGHIFGSKEVSRQVASQAAANTGLDVGILKKMLPMIAAMSMGGMSKQAQTAEQKMPGGLEGLLKGLTGGAQSAPQIPTQAKSGIDSIFGKFLDADNDGSVLDDVMGMAKKLF